jgi:hypothetical protein
VRLDDLATAHLAVADHGREFDSALTPQFAPAFPSRTRRTRRTPRQPR